MLHEKVNLGNGADTHNVTDEFCAENKKLCIEVNKALKLPMSGFDFICEDVSKPWQEQEFGFIENNTLPYIDMHHFPSHGKPINVAGEIWDYIEKRVKNPPNV